MSLVAYGSSDESDSESPDENVIRNSKGNHQSDSNINISPQEPALLHSNNLFNDGETKELFATLPVPKNTFSIPGNTFKLLNKKTQPVKIVLPSLNELSTTEDGDERKKPKPSKKGSGLFALLPSPKNTNILVPKSVKTKALSTSASKNKAMTPQVLNKHPVISKRSVNRECDDDEDDDTTINPQSFFFNSSDVKPEEMEPVDIPSLPGTSNNQNLGSFNMSDSSKECGQDYLENSTCDNIGPNQVVGSSVPTVSCMDAVALEKLCGVGARKRKGEMPDEILDISVDSIVGDAYSWLSKDLTKEQEHSSFKKAKNLSVVERRKHQITYLASQAKEKELELRNQWANSRMTRKQTQSKYGF